MTFTPRPGLHPIFETLAYTVGYAVYRRSRDRRGDFLPDEYRWLIIAAASIGALLGSRLLGLLEEIPISQLTWRNLLFPGGKTIVGGLLGGWLAVEIAKRFKSQAPEGLFEAFQRALGHPSRRMFRLDNRIVLG